MNHIDRGKAEVDKILKKVGNMPVSALYSDTFKDELKDAFPVFDDEIDTAFLIELLYYFPIDKTYISTGSYDQYLYDLEKTVIDNYESGNYQVSYFYAHLIFMSYVYYCVELAYSIWPEKVKDQYDLLNAYGTRNKPNLQSHSNTYAFSKIPEKEIFKVFYSIGMDVQYIQQLSGYVEKRDDYAHATGEGNINAETLEQNIHTIKRHMDKIHDLFSEHIRAVYVSFLLETYLYSYSEIWEIIGDFILENSLSIKDIEFMCNLGISNIRNECDEFREKYRFIKKVHCAFIEYCIENNGVEPPEGYGALRDEAYLFYRYKDHASDYVENELGISSYRCGKDGDTFPVFECPECDEEQLAYDAESGKFHCFACDANYTTDDYDFCENCGTLKKAGGPVCDECLEAAMEKD